MPAPLVTVAVPSLNHGQFLNDALVSIFEQDLPVEVFVADGGSTDETRDVIARWETRLAGWRSHPDRGQAAAINQAVACGSAPYIAWLNSDDWLLSGGLASLLAALAGAPDVPVAYGRAWTHHEDSGRRTPVWVEPFDVRRMALRCIVSQPATLIRRSAWESVGGLDESLQLALDYDLWWRLYRTFGRMEFVDAFVAVNRDHDQTKTRRQRRRHYREAIGVVRAHYGRVPFKWWLAQPYAVWFRALVR
ncbi:glycosyltransferase [Xanthobacteraceae bacterium Astr-EGSB]|uniref:glycosyltransferase n=1 Tax=Astrobacterium formosum TaxID=3069710 RepID=UPI0027ADF011|nr:glycosyltransferase [Xanthobacteraceae bacterium Astr-EGSB]